MASREAGHGESPHGTNDAHALISGDGTGSGNSEAHSLPLFQEMARPQSAVPTEISVWRGTVAMPSLTSATMGGVLCHDGLTVRSTDNGPY